MLTPFDLMRQGLTKAYLKIEQPRLPESQSLIPVHFNPTEYVLTKSNKYDDDEIPGLETPPVKFVRGNGETLSTELLVDTSDTLEDVRKKYVDKIRGLMNIQNDLHAPPIVRLVWDKDVFRGVLDNLVVTYVMFRPDGVPLRAKCGISMKEFRTVEEQLKERPRRSPDVEKSYTVARGDSLGSIAFKLFRKSSRVA